MKIYDIENFPNPLRVRFALAEKNVLYKIEFVPVDVMHGEHRSAEFLVKNPFGGVPVLELDDGTFIAECSAITEYIDQQFEGISLTGKGAKNRALINMEQRRVESRVLEAVADYFHHATAGLGPALETYQNKNWGEKQRENALRGFEYANKKLAIQEYLAGEDFSIADITLYAGLVFADFAQIEVPAELYHLQAWRSKIAGRPSLKDL